MLYIFYNLEIDEFRDKNTKLTAKLEAVEIRMKDFKRENTKLQGNLYEIKQIMEQQLKSKNDKLNVETEKSSLINENNGSAAKRRKLFVNFLKAYI